MFFQIHHQNVHDNSTEFILQCDANSHDEFQAHFDYASGKFPLPESCRWLICEEDSPYFLKQVE